MGTKNGTTPVHCMPKQRIARSNQTCLSLNVFRTQVRTTVLVPPSSALHLLLSTVGSGREEASCEAVSSVCLHFEARTHCGQATGIQISSGRKKQRRETVVRIREDTFRERERERALDWRREQRRDDRTTSTWRQDRRSLAGPAGTAWPSSSSCAACRWDSIPQHVQCPPQPVLCRVSLGSYRPARSCCQSPGCSLT
jgi:hypothetical protein